MIEWKPIAQAPKDRAILMFCPTQTFFSESSMVVGRWDTDGAVFEDGERVGGWFSDYGFADEMYGHATFEHEELKPTHWAELNPP